MITKVADMTIDDLKALIRDVLEEYISSENELAPEFADELERRIQSADWLDHASVWKDQ